MPDGTVLEGRGATPDVQVKATLVELRERDVVVHAALKAVRDAIMRTGRDEVQSAPVCFCAEASQASVGVRED